MDSIDLHLENLPRTLSVSQSEEGVVFTYIDQRELPQELEQVSTTDWRQVIDALKTLAVRGAPAIGVAAMAAATLWVAQGSTDGPFDVEGFLDATESIAAARPTAVNLRWGVEQIRERALALAAEGATTARITQELAAYTEEAIRADEAQNRIIGDLGAQLLGPQSRVLTHCNAGSLATCFYGTALGVIYSAAAQGRIQRVFADETRPVNQGARLTVWELARVGIPVTLLCDSMAASLMAGGSIDAVIVGADRIAVNGDTANKIGTYGLAVLASVHGIPFYVAAPTSTIDGVLNDGSAIPIEERSAEEVLPSPIPGVDVMNPAFDVTPARYITAIITERGILKPEELHSVL